MLRLPLILLLLLIGGWPMSSSANAELCPAPTLDSQLNLTLPCVGVQGQQYAAQLLRLDNSAPPRWRVADLAPSDCAWNTRACATLSKEGELNVLQLSLGDGFYTGVLALDLQQSDPLLRYVTHRPAPVKSGQSDSHGSLKPYTPPPLVDGGNQRKLLAIYMVGSDMESSWMQAATVDLLELLEGYRQLPRPEHVEVIVAFGGADKDGWRGMTIANMAQLLADARDGQFGNGEDYLYREPRAHMGDRSTLELFLRLTGDTYQNFAQSFLALWDHGGAYNGFGIDENYQNDGLSLEEMRQALQASGQRFDVIGFDACLMATAEIAAYLHPYTRYLLASEEVEPSHGWNWSDVILHYAQESDLKTAARQWIDRYVDHQRHAYRSSGKTLALLDASVYPTFQQRTDEFLDALRRYLQVNVPAFNSQAATALQRTRAYTHSHHISIDLLDFAINLLGETTNDSPSGAALQDSIQALINVIDRFVVYSQHDGTRPYSHGVSINPPDNPPHAFSFSAAHSALQKTWRQQIASDADLPRVTGQQNEVAAADAQLQQVNFREEELAALEGSVRQLFSLGAISATQFDVYLAGIAILRNPNLTLEEKELELAQLASQAGNALPSGFFKIWMRVWMRGGSFDKLWMRSGLPQTPRQASGKAQRLYHSAWPFLTGERAAFVHRPAVTPRALSIAQGVRGTVAQFSDSHPLKVTTIYGTIKTDPRSGERLFETTAELEAYPTENPNEFFTPTWNRVWYSFKFDPAQATQWLPMAFVKRYRENQHTYTVYNSRMHYRDARKTYPHDAASCNAKGYAVDMTGQCVEMAMLELVADDHNHVVSHKVLPYKQLAGAEGADAVVFDKQSQILKEGDQIRLLFETINMTSGEGGDWRATTGEQFITLKQAPVFQVELFAFIDKDTGEPLDFWYTMRAVDASGHNVTAAPRLAPVDLPSCETLAQTRDNLNAASTHLSNPANSIKYNSPLGARLDEAVDALFVVKLAVADAELGDRIGRLINLLYNENTMDRVNWTFVWDRIDYWPNVKAELDGLMPPLDRLYQAQCVGI